MSDNYLCGPFHTSLPQHTSGLPIIPTELHLPHIIGKPVQMHASGPGALKPASISQLSLVEHPHRFTALEPLDVYIRPLMIEAGWVGRSIPGKGRFWQPMVAGINDVDPTVLVAGPCFLEAVVRQDSDTGYRAGVRVPVLKRTYGYVTEAAQSNVACGRKCPFYFNGELARRSVIPFFDSLIFQTPSFYTVQAVPSPQGSSEYTVVLQEPADGATSRCSKKDPTSKEYQAPAGLHCAVLECTIHRGVPNQQTTLSSGLRLRLIFDRNVPLWRHEFPEPQFVPVARAFAHSTSPRHQ